MNSLTTVDSPDEATCEWVFSSIGECKYVSRYAHSHGYSQLWRLWSDDKFLWLKLHKHKGKWAGEVHALREWAPPLLLSPMVVAYRSDPPGLLQTEVPGQMATEIELGPDEERRLWYEAGLYLAKLHQVKNEWFGAALVDGSPQGAKAYDPVAFVGNNIEARLRQGTDRGHWSDEEREFIAKAMDTWCAALAGEQPAAIHRDFGPRNWMTDASGVLTGVIDWEHARWDVRAADLNRAWDDNFLRKPWLAGAFFEGYGGLDDQLRTQIQALRLLQACAGVVWSAEVGDDAYGCLNREALHRLMA